MPDIECRIAESMVTQYINHSLSVDELEEFLDHISHLDQDIRKSRRYIRKKRWFHFLTGLLLAVFAVLLLIFVIFFITDIAHFL